MLRDRLLCYSDESKQVIKTNNRLTSERKICGKVKGCMAVNNSKRHA